MAQDKRKEVPMARAKNYAKHIACLESFWSYDVENRLSVTPVLELLGKRNGTRWIILNSNTMDELKFNLEIYKRIKGGNILYLAFHGYPGGIRMPDLKIDIETLASLMGRKFRNWIIYFDSCSTLKVEKGRISDFLTDTGASMLIGFERNVDWLEGAAIDLLVLDWLQHYRNMGRFWKRFKRVYKDLVGNTGMKAFLK